MLHLPNNVTKYISRQVNFQTIDTTYKRKSAYRIQPGCIEAAFEATESIRYLTVYDMNTTRRQN